MHFATPKPPERLSRADDPVIFDLNRADHYELVRRIYLGRFTERVQAAGIDLDDGFQQVVEGLLRKSRSERSRWDPKRGSISTWVYVAISGLVINMAASASRLSRSSPDADADVASWAVDAWDGPFVQDESPGEVSVPASRQPVQDVDVVRVSATVIRVRKVQRQPDGLASTFRTGRRKVQRATQTSLFEGR